MVNTVQDTRELLALKAQIEGLSPGERLRLAAGLIEALPIETLRKVVDGTTQ